MTPLLHPEATEDPSTLRWITDTSGLADGAMAELVTNGTLAEVDVTPGQILTRLASGRSWAIDGPKVRTALYKTLSDAAPRDLQQQIAQLLDREVGPFVSSHGGALRVVSVQGDVVDVAFDGACGHCTLRNQTLTTLVSTAVRAKFPQIRDVRAVQT